MWTPVAKPSTSNYTNVNPRGKTQYDQADITYDDSSIYYDGVNPNQWTDVSKPNGYGLFTWNQMTMTWENAQGVWGANNDMWTRVTKPT